MEDLSLMKDNNQQHLKKEVTVPLGIFLELSIYKINSISTQYHVTKNMAVQIFPRPNSSQRALRGFLISSTVTNNRNLVWDIFQMKIGVIFNLWRINHRWQTWRITHQITIRQLLLLSKETLFLKILRVIRCIGKPLLV